MSSVILLIRQGVLGVTTIFSLIVLALAAHLISQTQQYLHATATFCSLGVAVGVISLVTLPVMLVVDFIRRGAFTSMIVVELVWLFILWVLWVAAAAETANEFVLLNVGTCNYTSGIANGMCQQAQAVEAFSFLNFIILFLYFGFLFTMTIIAAVRGQNVWLSSVKESFGTLASPAEHPMTRYNVTAPPQQLTGHFTGTTTASTQPVVATV